jgi:trimethylamine:corrinoid methyltransferase-like protein
VEEIARVADALEEVAFHWVPLSAQDKPAHTRGLHELAAVWRNSTKHVQTESIYTTHEAKAAVEMATALAGSREALRQRPLLSLMQCTAPPLAHDGGSLDAALMGAEAGLPVGFMTMAACLTTGPATLAATWWSAMRKSSAARLSSNWPALARRSFTPQPKPPRTCAPARTLAAVRRIFCSARQAAF